MGLKGISWIEQNVEKVVAGVFGVALLGVVAYQFVGEGNTIELTAGKAKAKYGYDMIWDKVEEQARTTKSQITTLEPDPKAMEVEVKEGDVLTGFTTRLRGAVAPAKALTADLDKPTLSYIIDTTQLPGKTKAEMYASLSAPAPGKPVGASYLATVHPQEVVANQDLAKLVGADAKELTDGKFGTLLPKLDRAAVSLESKYDGTALEAMLMADPDGDGPLSAMPRHWWDSGRVQIVAIEMERQELKPDGDWDTKTAVTRMPGRLDLLQSVKEMQSGGDVRYADILQMAQKEQEAVLRPAYYSIVLGDEWVPPSEIVDEVAAAGPGGDAVTSLKRRLNNSDTKLAELQESINKLEQEVTAPPGPGARQPPGGPAGGGGKTGGAPREGRQPDSGPKDPKQAKLDSIRARYAREYAAREKIVEELRRLGVEVDAPTGVAQPVVARVTEPVVPLLLDADVRLWSHDVTVQRGKTYRYRMTLVLNNPVFGKNAALDSKQAELAKEPLVRTAASEWSEPVSVDPDTFYFITSASPEDAFASAARASAEVFVFSMGFWRKGQVNLEPGDTIAADIRVPDPEKIVAMINADPNQQQIVPAQPGPGEFQPPGGPRGRPNLPPDRGERPLPVPPPNNGNPGEPVPIDPATILIPKTVAEDALLLDVATTTVVSDQGITKTKTENQAFLLNETGLIVVRTPEGDRSRREYQKVLQSAARGEEALRPRLARPMAPSGVAPGGDGPIPTTKEDTGGGGGG
jgi:hypothetical protein